MRVNTIQDAWNEANKLFPTDYEKDEESSQRAGYPIYCSTCEGMYYNYICDLGDRLEVNLSDGTSTNIWIAANAPEEQGNDVEVTVSVKSGETRVYSTYAEYRKEIRFFQASGARYDDSESHFEKIIKSLRDIDFDGVKVETIRSGQTIVFTYKKFR